MRSQGLLVAVVSSLVAAAAWFAWRAGTDAAVEAPPASVASVEPQPEAGAVAPAEAEVAAGAATGQPAVADAARREIAGPTAAGAAEPVRCTVRGRLVDPGGGPRADVEVRWSSWRIGGEIDGIAIPAAVADRQPRGEQHVQTAADGRFQFAIDEGRQGELHLDVERFVFRAGSQDFSTRAGAVDLGDVVVVAPAHLSGTVVDARGEPVAGVTVSVAAGMGFGLGGTSRTTTAADGSFDVGALHAGKWTLRTMSARHLPKTLAVEVHDEEHQQGLRLVLEQGQSIAGQVVDDRGVPVADVRVGAMRSERAAGMSIERFTSGESATSDAGGFFVLGGLLGATATVRATAAGHMTVTEPNVAVGTGDIVLRMARQGSIAGVLRDVLGKPIAGSRVSARAVRQGEMQHAFEPDLELEGLDVPPGMGARAVTVTAADGSFRIDGVEPGPAIVRARGKAHRPTERGGFDVQPGQSVEGIVLTAEIGAVVAVQVVDDQDQPVALAKVEVREPPASPGGDGAFASRIVRVERGDDHAMTFGDGPRQLGSGTTDDRGVVEIAGLPTGAVLVTGSHGELADAQPVATVLPAQGSVDVRLVLRRPGAANLSIVAANGVGVAASYLVHGPLGASEAASDRSGKSAATGKARVDRLAAGNYWVELRLAPQGHQVGGPDGAMFMLGGDARPLAGTRTPFRIEAGRDTELSLRLPTLTRLRGEVRGVDGPAADVVVELARVEAEGVRGEALGLPGMGGQQARSGGDGSFELTDVQPGRYQLTWGRSGQIVKASEFIDIPADTPELRRDLELRFGRLRLVVVAGEDGEPIEGAEVELVRVEAAGVAAPPRQRRMMMISMSVDGGGGGDTTSMTVGAPRAESDVDGLVEIADVPPGRYTVRVRHDRCAGRDLADQTVVERSTTDCGRVQLAEAGRIRGRVVGADGATVPMAIVTCLRADGSGEADRQPAMGGAFTFGGLEGGRYTLQAQSIGDRDAKGAPVEVEVTAGKAVGNVELRLP